MQPLRDLLCSYGPAIAATCTPHANMALLLLVRVLVTALALAAALLTAPAVASAAPAREGADVFAWGDGFAGADIPPQIRASLAASAGIDAVASTAGAFFVRTVEGGVFVWGSEAVGGDIPPEIQERLASSAGFTHVLTATASFFVRSVEGPCYAWGRDGGERRR